MAWIFLLSAASGLAAVARFAKRDSEAPMQEASKKKTYRAATHEVANATVPIDGLKCFGADRALVFYPMSQSDRKYPLIAFAPGDFQHFPGWNVETRYRSLLQGIARQGFVVAAPMAVGGWCYHAPNDQARIVSFARNRSDSSWTERIDWDAGIGFLGVSMGGKATFVNAARATGNVSAAVSIAPYWDSGRGDFEGLDQGQDILGDIDMPYMIIGGAQDSKSTPPLLGTLFDDIHSKNKALVGLSDYTHDDLCFSPSLPYYAGIFFSCTIKRLNASCTALNSLQDYSIEPTTTTLVVSPSIRRDRPQYY